MARSAAFIPSSVIPGAGVVRVPRYADERGWTGEVWSPGIVAQLPWVFAAVQENQSFTVKAGTVRGLHYQAPPFAQAKLVRAPAGRFLSVILDLRAGSPAYGRWDAVEIDGEAGAVHAIPRGCAHGTEALEANSVLAWLSDAPFAPEAASGVRWSDPAIAIPWRVDEATAIVSGRDRCLPLLSEVEPLP
jgi:dTDP-4-dehydrorhamnose 3,5-epimerase